MTLDGPEFIGRVLLHVLPRNLRRILAEDEALGAEKAGDTAAWAAVVLEIRHKRDALLTADDRAFETGLEMMEGTANYAARVAAGETPAATAARLRAERQADQIRWRYYNSGAAICLLLDRFRADGCAPGGALGMRSVTIRERGCGIHRGAVGGPGPDPRGAGRKERAASRRRDPGWRRTPACHAVRPDQPARPRRGRGDPPARFDAHGIGRHD